MKPRHLLLAMAYLLTLAAGLAMGHKIGHNATWPLAYDLGVKAGQDMESSKRDYYAYQKGFQACQDQF